jgi:polyisoprenoid-binding protein YceI
MKFHLVKIGIVLLLSCFATAAQEKAEYSIDSAKSKLEINVYKEGVFKAFGHNHLIIAKQMSGGVQFDSKKIEGSAVNLKVETSVSAVKTAGDGWTLTLSGKLTLHGVEKPIRLPVAVHVNGNQLQAQGKVSLLQTDYGINPVKAGGGAVTVKDELKISFDIVTAK